MTAILLILSALLILVDLLIHRSIFSPIMVFCGLWAVIVFLSSLRLFGFSGFDENAVKIILYGVLGFGMGCMLVEVAYSQAGRTESNEFSQNRGVLSLNMRLLHTVLVLVCIGQLISLFTTLSFFSQGATYVDVRGARLGYTDDQYFSSPFLFAFINYFCGPALTMLIPVAIILWVTGSNRTFCFIVLLCVASSVFSSGGRITLVYSAIQLMAALHYFRDTVSKKNKHRIIAIFAFGTVAVVMLTAMRSGISFLESAYSYFTIPVGLLSVFTDVVDSVGFESFGGAFLYPIFYVANAVINAFGIELDYLTNLIHYVALPQNTWIGGLFLGRSYNAFASLFYYFYLDFREPGVLFFSLVYGLIMAITYRKAFVERSEVGAIWYLLALQSMFGSFIIWQLGNTKFFVSMILLFVAQKGILKKTGLRGSSQFVL